MPALKAMLEKAVFDELPEENRGFYIEKEGKFFLEVEGAEDLPALANLKQQLAKVTERSKEDRKKSADEIKALRDKLANVPDDFNPEEIAQLRAKVEEYEADPERNKSGDRDKERQEAVAARRMLEQKIASEEKKHVAEIERLNKAILKKDNFISQLLIDEGLTKALVDVGVQKEYMKAAKALLRQDVKVQEEDGEYNAVVTTDTGDLDIARYVSDWVASDEGKAFVPAPKGADAGGPTKSSSSKPMGVGDRNPWSPEHWNMTEQGKILRMDRARAEKLAKAAGKKLGDAVA